MQLWHSGMIQNIDRDHRGMVNIQPENLVDYGVDGFAQGDFGNQDNHVEVPEIEFGLDEQRLQQLGYNVYNSIGKCDPQTMMVSMA